MRISDWSSDVCSSDLLFEDHLRPGHRFVGAVRASHRLVRLAEEAERAVIRWIDLRRMLEQSGGLFHVARGHACAAVEEIGLEQRSEEHTSELQSLMRISYAVFCLKKKNTNNYDRI